jgi:thiol-disulfide isomerase/thioredoxin
MLVLHFDPSSENEEIDNFNKLLKDDKDLFVLFYLEGCGPCNATRPEWDKIKNVLKDKYDDSIIIADIDQSVMEKFENLNIQPTGFPAIYHISNKGKTYTSYDDSDISNKDRTIDSFVEWIETTTKQNKMVGGKWSLKYKRSINCKRPRGFSQKQHCKYGRKKIFLTKNKQISKRTIKVKKINKRKQTYKRKK